MGESFDVNADLVMMNFIRFPAEPVPGSRKIPAGTRHTAQITAKQRLFRPIVPQDRTVNDGTKIAWPTNKQSRTPDGQFGPAKQINGWGDCWFLAVLGAVANNEQGRQILAGSIKKATIEGIRGYAVTFQGSPNNAVFISDQTLDHCVEENGGDADTRLLQLAADQFFSVNGSFRALFIAALANSGMNQDQVEQCLNFFCQTHGIQDPISYNPMRRGCSNLFAYFMVTGIYPDVLLSTTANTLQISDIKAYLIRYGTNSQGGPSISLGGNEHPLGNTRDTNNLLQAWDVIRTDITANGTVDAREQAFLNALGRWLKTPDASTRRALRLAAGNLKLQHLNPQLFITLLDDSQIVMRPHHRAILRSAVQEVLGAGPGYIGIPGDHSETIEGINAAQNTFTYSDPNFPTVVHTGELSSLIQATANGQIFLFALKPTTGKDEAESSHAGERRGRHLLTFHHQAVNDGTIDAAESRPLANLMAMDDGTFRHVYDSDRNGVIQGSELKAVQLRVDRWVKRLTLTPVW